VTAMVLYESMFGNTRRIAEAIGDGLAQYATVRVGSVAAAGGDLTDADLVVVGAPTHAHSLPRAASREDAARWARDPEQHLELEADADAAGVREWIESLDAAPRSWAAFGTRVAIPRIFAGDASAVIEKRLHRLGSRPAADSECFLVTTENVLLDGELDRARAWGAELGRTLLATGSASAAEDTGAV
jgi:Flavodoxin domain